MVDNAAAGRGRRTHATDRTYEVAISDVYGDIAAATVHAVPYVDYVHLLRTADGWRIVNALWCPTQAS
jgi:putative lumazine-binding protein